MNRMARTFRMDNRRAGFTLVELLVVLGIIIALFSVLLPVVFSTRRKAEIARTRLDLNTISIALEEYKKVFNDYPRQADPNQVPRSPLLATYLLGPGGEGIRAAGTVGGANQGGKKWGPYLPVDKFKLSPNGLLLLDGNGTEIQYYPRYNSYDVHTTAAVPGSVPNDGYLLGRVSASRAFASTPAIRAMFNRYDGVASDKDHQLHTLYMLGDGGDGATINPPNNQFDGAETLSFNGPFILVSAGADTKWGLNGGTVTRHANVDDVYNFER